MKKSWTLRAQHALSSLILLSLTAALVTPAIVLPHIELQRVHLEYDIPEKNRNSLHPHDRSVQEQNTTSIKYDPIRIVFDTRVLDSLYGLGNTDVDAKIDFIKSTILPQTAQKWSQHLYVPPVVSWITPILIGPQSCGGWYGNFLTTSIQYTDADLVIIVGGDPDSYCSGGTLAYAIPCSFDATFDRPITGTFNFCLSKLSSTSLQISDGTSALQRLSGSNIPSYYSVYANTTFYPERLSISILDVTVHEVAHILGFSDLLYPYTRDEFGVPRTARNASNFNQPAIIQRTCGNGTITSGYFPSENVVVVQSSVDDPTRYEHYFVTERVRTISQLHFNCSSLIGARLEDIPNGERQCFGAHWHERLYYGELLSPTVSQGSENILSLLTLAFMEDTGWYQVDYRGAGYPSFGLGAGCDFVFEPCINSTSGEVLKAAENEFCNTPLYLNDLGIPTLDSLNSILCDPSHQSWVICDLSDIGSVEAEERTYFPDEFLTTIFFRRADNCPIPSLNLGIDCFDDTIAYNPFYAGESVGPNSRCLNAYSDSVELGRAYRPACISVTCDMTERVVRIGTEQICEYDGQLLLVPGERSDGATFICPRLATICPALFTCPDGCFGRGECVYNNVDSNGRTIPTCRCFDANNTHPSCAPSFIANRATNSPTLPTTPPSPAITGPPSVFNPAVAPPSTTANPVVAAVPTSISSPIQPTIQPEPPTQSIPPNETAATRAPSSTIRGTNAPATDPPTSIASSASAQFLSHPASFIVTTTTLMLYLIGL